MAHDLENPRTKKYSKLLSGFLKENNRYEIALKDGLNYKVENYFDIYRNNWKLDNFPDKISETYERCKEKMIIKDS